MIEEGSPFLFRTCAECLKYNWSDDGVFGADRKKHRSVEACVQATGKEPWRRPVGTIPPCFKCPKVPKDAPRKSHHYAVEITDATWDTIRHYDECEATHSFPVNPVTGDVDAIVKRNAGIIKQARESARRGEMRAMVTQALTLNVR